MFHTKEVTVFDRSVFKKGHFVKVAIVDNETKEIRYHTQGMISRVDNYNIQIEEAKGGLSSIYVGQVEGYPGEDYSLVASYRFLEISATPFSEE